jgi:hypothetical protein
MNRLGNWRAEGGELQAIASGEFARDRCGATGVANDDDTGAMRLRANYGRDRRRAREFLQRVDPQYVVRSQERVC